MTLARRPSGLRAQPDREGKDFALFFPVNEYQNAAFVPLDNPIDDAEDIAATLREEFGFETEIVKNGTVRQIKNKLREYVQKYEDGILPSDGQLLIFFSGHGVIDANVGYFLPADADPQTIDDTGISYHTWRNKIDEMNCQHILVAIDACFSSMFLDTGVRGAVNGREGESKAKDYKFLAQIAHNFDSQ